MNHNNNKKRKRKKSNLTSWHFNHPHNTNINKVLKSTSNNTRLAFPSIIQRLCDEAGVEKIIDEVLVKQDKFITAKKMAKVVVVNPLQRARE